MKENVSLLLINYKYMYAGNTTQETQAQLQFNPFIYLMDIRNYTWVHSFEYDQNKTINNTSLPNQPSTIPTTSNPQFGNQPSGNNGLVQVVAMVVSVVGVVALIVAFL